MTVDVDMADQSDGDQTIELERDLLNGYLIEENIPDEDQQLI